MLNDTEIKEWFDIQTGSNVVRNAQYTSLETSFWNSEYTDAVSNSIAAETRRPGDTTYKKIVNFVQARVRDKVIISGEIPEIKMTTPPFFSEEDLLQTEVDKTAIYDLWEHSNITWLAQNRFGYYSSLFGTCPILTLPDFDNKKMLITTRHPQTMSAEADAKMNGEVCLLGFTTAWTGRQLLMSYPELSKKIDIANNGNYEYEVHEFFDKNRRLFFVGGVDSKGSAVWARIPERGVKHDLGFIPAQIFGNIINKDGVGGLSDVLSGLPSEENANEILSLWNSALRETMDATLVVSGDTDAKPEEMPVGSGLILNLPRDVTAQYIRKMTGNPAEVTNMIGMLTDFFKQTSGLSDIRLGKSPTSSVGTGKQVANLMSMSTDDVNSYRSGVGNALVSVNEKALAMHKQMFPKDEHKIASSLNAEQQLRQYHGDMISDYPKHTLQYAPSGMEAESIRLATIQIQTAGFISKHKAREILPNVNPLEEKERIRAEKDEELADQKKIMDMQNEQQMMMQQAQQPQAPAGPPQIQQAPIPQIPEELVG